MKHCTCRPFNRSWRLLGLLLTAACEDAAPLSADTCEAPRMEIYTSPGCGPEVKPSCLGGAGACASQVCSCDGRLITACGSYAREQYQAIDLQSSPPAQCKPFSAR
jgi:hypothetical protein